MTACSVPDCGKPAMARGWCRTHYDRWYERGSPTPTPAKRGMRRGTKIIPSPGVGPERVAELRRAREEGRLAAVSEAIRARVNAQWREWRR